MKNFWKNFWLLAKPYWLSEEKWTAGLLLSGIVFFIVFQVKLMVIFNRWSQYFYNSLQLFNLYDITLLLIEFAVMIMLAAIVFTYADYFSALLVNRWRKFMTQQYTAQWLDDSTAYALQTLNQKLDNPDQRISQDLNEFPLLTLGLFSGFLNAVLTFVSFSAVLWQLSGDFKLSIFQGNFAVPHAMLWGAFIYAAIGTLITAKIGKNLMQLNYQQEKCNADFRFGLIRVREHAEQIALYKGQKLENQRLRTIFEPVFKNYFEINTVGKQLGFFTNGYNLMIQVAGILLALPRYIAEKIQIGYLLQAGAAFEKVVSALSFVVDSFSSIANWRAVILRLTEFNHLIRQTKQAGAEKNIFLTASEDSIIYVKNLTLNLPGGQTLIHNLTFEIRAGEHTLIAGKYGSGKSTLLRAFANLWLYGKGTIMLPAKKTLFLPQKPYFPLGSLKEILLYPDNDFNISDQQIKNILICCNLNYLSADLYSARNWPLELSLGEQQLMAFARVFILQPDWLFLDEATSALDEDTEQKIYQILQENFSNMTIVSVGHRAGLKKFHRKEIYIEKYVRTFL